MIMRKGVIGIFCEKSESSVRCSVSVRQEQTKNELEKQIKSEHPDIDISLDRMFTFDWEGELTDVEVLLRKILSQAFGMYKQYEHWDSYLVESTDKFIEFIENVLTLSRKLLKWGENR